MKLARSLRSLLLVGTIAAATSCGDRTPVDIAGSEASRVGRPANANNGVLRCSPLAYDSVTKTIGPAGGDIWVGPHRLSVSRNALAGPVSITAVMPSDTVSRIQFRPEGLRFARPASLLMSYANCTDSGAAGPKVAYTTDALQIIEYVPSKDYPWFRRVHGVVTHFSNYAVAW
jgi:hypothetical protein